MLLKSCETASMNFWDSGGQETSPCSWDWRGRRIYRADPQRAEISHTLCWIKSLPSSSGGKKSLLSSLLDLRAQQGET